LDRPRGRESSVAVAQIFTNAAGSDFKNVVMISKT